MGVGLGGILLLALAAIAYVYLASERIIARIYPLPPSHIHASADPKVIALGEHLVRPYGCADCHRRGNAHPMSVPIHPDARKRRDCCAEQIHDEQPSERDRT